MYKISELYLNKTLDSSILTTCFNLRFISGTLLQIKVQGGTDTMESYTRPDSAEGT